MAPWPHIIPSNLRINLLHPYFFSILTVTALSEGLTQPNSSSFTYTDHESISSFEHFQRSFFSVFGHVSNLARQRDLRISAAQLGFWDFGFLIMACGLIQSFRIWKKRRQSQRAGSVHSNSSIIGGRLGRENTRASLDDNGNSRKGECTYLVR